MIEQMRGIHRSWWRWCLLYGVALGKDGTAVLFNREYGQLAVRPLGGPSRHVPPTWQWGDARTEPEAPFAGWEEDYRLYFFYDGNPPWSHEASLEVVLRQMRMLGVAPLGVLRTRYPEQDYSRPKPKA